jgi:outer membrane biosynthesis protein TonB
MSGDDMPGASLRQERTEVNRLVWAMVISLALHLTFVGTYQAGKKYHWWDHLQFPRWMQIPMLSELLEKKKSQQAAQLARAEVPLVFLDVSPDQETPEPPKDAKFYSDKNSMAANPDADKESDTPKITGKQTDVPKTQDVPREKTFTTLQPTPPPIDPPPVEQAPQEQEEQKPKPTALPGDLTMAKPDQTAKKEEQVPKELPKEEKPTPTPRPRTVKEALARKNLQSLPGDKMKQEGGVKRRLEISSLDAKASPFGAYDRALIEAISQRWYSLLDERSYASDSRGRVVLQFSLHQDGRITDLNVAENSTSEMLSIICQKAVRDPEPYAPWPTEMRRTFGEVRNIQFSFYYN